MEELIGKEAVKNYIVMGSDYNVDGEYFNNFLSELGIIDGTQADYNYNMVKKYIN